MVVVWAALLNTETETVVWEQLGRRRRGRPGTPGEGLEELSDMEGNVLGASHATTYVSMLSLIIIITILISRFFFDFV